VVVVGVPGVGKTTVAGKLASAMEGSRLVTFGTVMLDEGKRLGWLKHRDELRKLPVERQRKLQAVAATKISRMPGSVLLVDTHLFIKTKEGFWPGLPFDVVRALKPTHLILVEADPHEILARRMSDKSRYRDEVTVGGLEEALSLARSFLAVSSTLTGAPMLVASNGDGKSDLLASGLAQVLGRAAS
jgi:adenylate kinase